MPRIEKIAGCIFCAAMLVLPFSCKKNEQNTVSSKEYLIGAVTVGNYRSFIKPGESVAFYPKGVFHPKQRPLGCYSSISGVPGTTDTAYYAHKNPHYISGDKSHSKIVKTFPEWTGTYRVYFYVYPIDEDKYYNSYGYTDITVVKEDSTMSATKFNPAKDGFKDGRDGQQYNYFISGDNVKWMSQNLAYRFSSPTDSLGHDYRDSPAVRRILGVFYTWTEAKKACPAGWELPKDSDWVNLAKWLNSSGSYEQHKPFADVAGKMMVNATFNGDKVWQHWPDVKIVDDDHVTLGAIPMGYMVKKAPVQEGGAMCDFLGSPEYACFWTADEFEQDKSRSYYRYIFLKEDELKVASGDKATMAMTVRCIQR